TGSMAATGSSTVTQVAAASQAAPVQKTAQSASIPEVPDALEALNHSAAADVALLPVSGTGSGMATPTSQVARAGASHSAPAISRPSSPTVGDILTQDEHINAQLTQVSGKDGVFLQFGAFSGHQNAQAL